MVLSKAQISAAADLVTETVTVPEWGGEVLVRALSEFERQQFLAKYDEKSLSTRVELCAAAIIDENGAAMFTLAEAEELKKKSATAISRVFTVAKRLAGLDEGEVEGAEKNSDSGPSAALPSGSRLPSAA